MPSGWDVYYIVILAAVLALGIPALLSVLSRVFSGPKQRRGGLLGSRKGSVASPRLLGKKINTRFFLAVSLSVALITLVLALVPCVAVVREGQGPGIVARALILIVTFSGVATLALLHASKKNDLSWLRARIKDR